MLNEKFTQKKVALSEDDLDAISGGSWLSDILTKISNAVACPHCGSFSVRNIGGKDYECRKCYETFTL